MVRDAQITCSSRDGVIVIVGLGIDLIENCRVERELAQGNWAREDGVFSNEEITCCSSSRRPSLRYALCFAAKEAALKALGTEVNDLAVFREVEVKCCGGREYGLALHARLQSKATRLGVRRINLAIAMTKRQTGAMVILES